jgi:hypothetical protein
LAVRNNLTVATPPAVSAADAQEAINRITGRRTRIDDPNAWRLSDDPGEVLAYLRTYSRGVPRWVAEEDILDGLTLRLRLWWQGMEAELWLLERAHRLGVPSRAVGRRLGLDTRQGLNDRRQSARKHLSKLHSTWIPGAPPAPRPRRDELDWIASHRREILDIAAEALEYRELANDEAAEWLAEVARDVRDQVVTPGSLQTLRFALIDLSSSPAVATDAPDHLLQHVFSRWLELYESYPGS